MKRYSFLTLVALFLSSATAMARSYNITQGSITFTKVGDVLRVQQGIIDDTYYGIGNTFSNILIYGNSTVTDNTILIDTPWGYGSGYETIITLSNVVIHTDSSIPIELKESSLVKMFLAAGTSNEVKTTALSTTERSFPAIKVSIDGGNPRLTIKGSGTLVAEGGELSAGIGGNWGGGAGEITIEDNVTVVARGGIGGAGIGGGETPIGGEAATGCKITISSNAVVFAQGGSDGTSSFPSDVGGAAAIGGGGSSAYNNYVGCAGGIITISGKARVYAQGGTSAAGIGGGSDGSAGTISIGPNTKVVAFSDGTRPAVDDDGATLDGNGYVLLINYYNPKAAGTTNTLCSRNWSILTNIVAAANYQSLAISLAQTNTYRLRCNSIIQEHQGSVAFPVITTGMAPFSGVADTNTLLFTLSTPVAVPYSWLADQYPGEPEANYEALANSVSTNGFYVWASYVAGLVPTNPTSTFKASINFTNEMRYISWTPNYPDRVYTVKGKAQLGDSTWGSTNNASRFFKVSVEMP